MRRYFLYLAVGVLTFGVGLGIVFKFYQKTKPKPEIFQNIEMIKPLIIAPDSQTLSIQLEKTPDTKVKGNLTCSDKTLRLVWKQLKKEIVSTFGKEQSGDCIKYFTVEKIDDLNDDGKNEILVQSFGPGFCGATGNCQLYVFSQKRDYYKLILSADMTQRFNIKNTKSNSYFDIETLSHGSVSSGDLTVYKFSGKQYEAKKCFDYDYADNNDRTLWLDKPNLIKKKCWENSERNY